MRRTLIALVALVPISGCGESETNVSYTTVTSPSHDCAKGPNASIETSDGTFRFAGTCDRIVVNGGNNKFTIEAAKRIEVNGANNVVEISAVDIARLNSPGNTINYKKG